MQNDECLNMKIELKTLGPVHIGCGEIISKKECLFGKSIEVMNIDKVIETAIESNLVERFSEYMETSGQNETFDDFFGKLNNNDLNEKFKDCIKYKVKNNLGYEGKENIHQFIRDGGKAYVPASSIKGAINTAIIATRFKEEQDYIHNESVQAYVKLKSLLNANIKDKVEKMNKDIEEKIKTASDNKEKSLLQGVIIRDSDYIGEDLEVNLVTYLEKKEKEDKKGNKGKKGNKIPFAIECIPPGETIQFDVVIDPVNLGLFSKEYVDEKLKYIKKDIEENKNKQEEYTKHYEHLKNIQDILHSGKTIRTDDDNGKICEAVAYEINRCIKIFFEDYEKYYRNVYEKLKKEKNIEGKNIEEKNIIYLGAKTGFINKTILCQALDRVLGGDEKPKQSIRANTVHKNNKKCQDEKDAPKLAKVMDYGNEKYREFGMCSIEITYIK